VWFFEKLLIAVLAFITVCPIFSFSFAPSLFILQLFVLFFERERCQEAAIQLH
jgi:hypothetical protein